MHTFLFLGPKTETLALGLNMNANPRLERLLMSAYGAWHVLIRGHSQNTNWKACLQASRSQFWFLYKPLDLI